MFLGLGEERGNNSLCHGLRVGPPPVPVMVRDFQAVVGLETREQTFEKWGKSSDVLIAFVGGGSGTMVCLIGVEPAAYLVDKDKYVTPLQNRVIGEYLGGTTYMLANPDNLGHPSGIYSGGLMCYGAGPKVSFLKDLGRVECYATAQKKQIEEHIFSL
ncbi:hypothetical protein LXL04_037456 [Taraxacum kok-saghyz]